MANPSENNVHAIKSGARALPPRVSPEEADRLAARYHASWELDAAETPPPPAPEPKRRGERPSEKMYAAEAHAPAARADVHEPENSVIIDRSITAADLDAAARPSARPVLAAVSEPRPVPAPVAAVAVDVPEVAPVSKRTRSKAPPVPRRAPAAPVLAAPVLAAPTALDLDDAPEAPPRSKLGLLVGIGVAAAAAAAVAFFVLSSGGDKPAPAAQESAAIAKGREKTSATGATLTTAGATSTSKAPAAATTAAATTTPSPPATATPATARATDTAAAQTEATATPKVETAKTSTTAAPARPRFEGAARPNPPPVTRPAAPPPAAKADPIVKRPSF